MMLKRVGPRTGAQLWLSGVAVALVLGVAAATSLSLAAGLAVVLVAVYGMFRSRVRAEIVVALFWIAFDLYYTLFAHVSLPGFFYPFYAVFAITIGLRLLRSELRFRPSVVIPYALFMLIVAGSFLGFNGTVDFQLMQRLIAYLFGLVILLQPSSKQGLGVIAGGAIVASTTVASWVVVRAAQGGFGYRGDINIDQNVVAFEVGIGLVMVAALLIHFINRRTSGARLIAVMLLLTLHLYSFMLLASRGVSIALGISLVAMLVRGVRDSRRALLFVALLAVVVGAALVLPGGQELVQRFQGERVQTASGRIPIWETTVSSYTDSNVLNVLLGHGFNSSKSLVERHFVLLSSTHEAYLEMLYEFGIIGLALFLAMHAVLVVRGWSLRNAHGMLLFGLVWFLLGADLSLDVPDGFLYWIGLGFAMALATWGGVPADPPALEDTP